jgi:hypothetical protein
MLFQPVLFKWKWRGWLDFAGDGRPTVQPRYLPPEKLISRTGCTKIAKNLGRNKERARGRIANRATANGCTPASSDFFRAARSRCRVSRDKTGIPIDHLVINLTTAPRFRALVPSCAATRSHTSAIASISARACSVDNVCAMARHSSPRRRNSSALVRVTAIPNVSALRPPGRGSQTRNSTDERF